VWRRGGHGGVKTPLGGGQVVADTWPAWRRVVGTSANDGRALRPYQGRTSQMATRPAWSSVAYHKKQGTACGIKLPEGLVESPRLPQPIFTPTTKADQGLDLPLSFDELVEQVGGAMAEQLRDMTLKVYAYAAKVAREKGIIIADTKMEFGELDGRLILIDELLTPDSSRFWDAAHYQPGKTPASFDKQYLRDWLERSDWNKEPPAPELPADVVANTRRRYVEALERLTGKGL
jgi:phosphoribosylaminoimidazole-succinocarboxamide synthase